MEANSIDFWRSEGYKSWDRLKQHCDTLEGFTAFEKEEAKRAFEVLRKELGGKFPTIVFDDGHILSQFIINTAPWTRKWLTWFADAIRVVKRQENYLRLIDRIKDKDKFSEVLSILKPAYKFSKVGFRICFDPSITFQKKSKIPDLKLTNKENSEDLFVEVSILKKAKNHRDAFTTEFKISEPIWECTPFLLFSGKIHKVLYGKHLLDTVKEVEELTEKTKKEN